MLPSGHIAAGYLTAEALLRFYHPGFSAAEATGLLWWGTFFGFAPDLDMFLAFAAARGWTFYGSQVNHRNFQSHAPVIWLAAGLLVFFLAPGPYWKAVGLLLWLASWSHFLLDTIEYGIMWGWPLSSRVVALRGREVRYNADRGDFFGYWFGFLRWYATTRVSFWLELAVIFSGIYVFISNHVR